ncbi:glutathione peroxidase [Paenibacillus sp. GCM10027626]|uniref:glutathione peroxidase n=1 Tax=Paenibacillus sp. GCM10027626 TaxID=3273411 RepID=UPI00363667AD
MTTVYDFQAETIGGELQSLSAYKGKVLLIVNTASKCGFTRQYADLQQLYEQYKDKGLEILGFPCNQFGGQEPGSNEEVEQFCQVNYGVSFPLFAKIDVRDEGAHPLFQYLTEAGPFKGFDTTTPGGQRMDSFLREKMPEWMQDNSIKWNFTKFLVDRSGHVAGRFESVVEIADLKEAARQLL